MKNKRLLLFGIIVAAMLLSIGIHVVDHPQLFRADDGMGNASSSQSNDPVLLQVPVVSGTPGPDPVDVSLFAADNGVKAVWSSKTPAALRSRVIEPNFSMLTQSPVLKVGDRLALPLFDDAVLDTIISDVTSYPNGSVGMTAHLQGDRKGTVYVAYDDGRLSVYADMLGGHDYYVCYDPKQNTHLAIEVDKASSDYIGKCIEVPESPSVAAGDAVNNALPANDAPVGDGVVYDAPASTVIDVMVVYTPAARTYANASAGGINNAIALAMQMGNEVHANSDTRVTLNLVHSEEVAYTEAETTDPVNGDPGDDLHNLTYTGGVYADLDQVQTLRDSYNADLVCLFESTDLTGGLGWLLSTTAGRPDRGFCIARVQQVSWTYTVVHEWGHNMGCSHSKTQSIQPWSDDLFTYSAGWQWSDSASSYDGYCSVMTYEDFDGDGYKDYERVPYFSNPSITYTGDYETATGDVADGDNAKAIRNTRQVIAEYRVTYGDFTLFPLASYTNCSFQWQTMDTRQYSLYWSSYLPTGFSLIASNLVSGGAYTDVLHSAAQAGFFKLEAQPAP